MTTIYHVVRATSHHSRKSNSDPNLINSLDQPTVYFVKKTARKRSIIVDENNQKIQQKQNLKQIQPQQISSNNIDIENNNNNNNNNIDSPRVLISSGSSTSSSAFSSTSSSSSSSEYSPRSSLSPSSSCHISIMMTDTKISFTPDVCLTPSPATPPLPNISVTLAVTPPLSPHLGNNNSKPEEERREELKQLLSSVIPCVMIGVEAAETDITSIFSIEDLNEKRPSCQVLIGLSKVLKEYPKGMGYIPRPLPSCLSLYPKLREFRSQMDLLIWEINSKLSILREFIESTQDVQNLYVVALSIRDAKNCFTVHECEHYIKSIDEIDPSLSRKLFASSSKPSNPKPVMSRAPRDVIDSTKNMVNSAIESKSIQQQQQLAHAGASAGEEKVSLFRNLISQQVNAMKTNPQEYKKNLLKHRRDKLEGSSENAINTSSTNLNVKRSSTSMGNSPNILSKSPDSWPNGSRTPVEKSRNSIAPPGKAGRSFSDPSIFNEMYLSPSIERITRHYKLQVHSPSASSTNITSLVTPPHLNLNAELDTSQEWDKYNEDLALQANCHFLQQVRGFKTDSGCAHLKSLLDTSQYMIREETNDQLFYRDDFAERHHMNFLGVSKGADKTPIAISICSCTLDSGEMELLYIIRTQEGDERLRFNFGKSRDLSGKDMIKLLKKSRQQFANYRIKEIKEENILVDLLDFEAKNSAQRHFKFGVLYCRDGQTIENEIYHNHEPFSKHYNDFLELLGERIELKDWKGYRGGLDIRDNMTGTHSIHRYWRNYQIMFHVATMIPYKPDDVQQIDRKRHLGNDIVILVFKEGNTPISPSIFKSNFNHIFAVVQVDEDMSTPENTFYKFSISCKDEITSFGPSFPKNYSFSSEELKEFLITKMTNGERWVLNSPVFSQKFVRARREFLQSYINDYFEN